MKIRIKSVPTQLKTDHIYDLRVNNPIKHRVETILKVVVNQVKQPSIAFGLNDFKSVYVWANYTIDIKIVRNLGLEKFILFICFVKKNHRIFFFRWKNIDNKISRDIVTEYIWKLDVHFRFLSNVVWFECLLVERWHYEIELKSSLSHWTWAITKEWVIKDLLIGLSKFIRWISATEKSSLTAYVN